MILYLCLGILGFPVFTNGDSGFMKFAGPTGGYLIGYPIGAFVIARLIRRNLSFTRILFAMGVGLVIIHSLGVLHLGLMFGLGWKRALMSGSMIFSWWDALKLLAAASITFSMKKKITVSQE